MPGHTATLAATSYCESDFFPTVAGAFEDYDEGSRFIAELYLAKNTYGGTFSDAGYDRSNQEVDSEEGGAPANVVNIGRYSALKHLKELENLAKKLTPKEARDLAIRSCRDAVALASFWPADLHGPEVDIDDDGIVSVEHYREDGTIRAILEFLNPDQIAFAILDGTAVQERGYISNNNTTQFLKVFDLIRAAED